MLPSEYLKRGWCQKALALDSKNNSVVPGSEKAVTWCTVGALIQSHDSGNITEEQYIQLQHEMNNIILEKTNDYNDYKEYFDLHILYNDHPNTKHYEIIELMQQAETNIGLRK